MKTAREISVMASTNRQAVYSYIRKHGIKGKALNKQGTHLYSDKDAAKIVKALENRPKRQGVNADYQLIKSQLIVKDDQIKASNATIQELNQTIRALNAQLALQKQSTLELNQHQQKLLEDTAVLKAQSKENMQKLYDMQKRYDAAAKRIKEQTAKLDQLKHASFWQRLTGRIFK